MAILIPDSALSDAEITLGEKKIIRKFQQSLNDECIIWFQPKLQNLRRPDLIIYLPETGLILYEIKDWSIDTIIEANIDFWRLKFNGKIENKTSPFKQVRSYFYNLSNNLRQKRILINTEGEHKGKIKLPIATAIAFPNITKREYQNRNLSTVIEEKYILFKEEIKDIGIKLGPKALIDKIKSHFDPWWPNDELNKDELDSLRGFLYPEITSKQKDSKGATKDIILDINQEQIAKKIGGGHKIVRGVAGSGKSLVLCAKARMLVQEHPSWNILLTCYNISLASQLKYYIKTFGISDDDSKDLTYKIHHQVEVMHFHKLAKSIFRQAKKEWPQFNDQQVRKTSRFKTLKEYEQEAELDEMQSALLGQELQNIAMTKNLRLYDAILIDESQDFHPSWLKALTLLLNGDTNFLLLAEDPNQKIYPRTFSYKNAGVDVIGGGKIYNLPISYRSTAEIVLSASRLINQSNWDAFYKKFISLNDDLAMKATKTGNLPVLKIQHDYDEICRFIAEDIKDKVNNGYKLNDFGILYLLKACDKSSKTVQKDLFNHESVGCRPIDYVSNLRARLASEGIEHYWLTENRDSKQSYDQFQDMVTISTIFSAKGLEFDTVYIVGLELYPWSKRNDRENASILYVAMTRAKNNLYLFSTQETAFTAKIREAIEFTAKVNV